MKVQTLSKTKRETQTLKQRVSLVLVLSMSIISLAGCSKEEGATPIGRNQATAAPTTAWAQSSGITLNGDIQGNTTQNDFQDAVSGFIEAWWAPEDLGYVSADASGGTGVFLGGRVELQSGALSTSNQAQVNVRSDSKLFLAVYDEYTNRKDANGQVVPPLTRAFASASGYVRGTTAYITFSGEIPPGSEQVSGGTVVIEGTFTSEVFTGRITYDNTRRWDGAGQGAAGDLGDFRLPTCQFFRCK